jgi:hypothetical protein
MYVCRVDPRCGKKFVRHDLLSRHEVRHQKMKKRRSINRCSPAPQIAPAPLSGQNISNQMPSSIKSNPGPDRGSFREAIDPTLQKQRICFQGHEPFVYKDEVPQSSYNLDVVPITQNFLGPQVQSLLYQIPPTIAQIPNLSFNTCMMDNAGIDHTSSNDNREFKATGTTFPWESNLYFYEKPVYSIRPKVSRGHPLHTSAYFPGVLSHPI